jgi:archaellum component FlaC
MEDALKRLDKLTHDEARMANAQVLKTTHLVDERVRGVADQVVAVNDSVAAVSDRVASVDERVASVDNRVKGVDDRVANVDERVASVGHRVQDVEHRVAGVDERVKVVDDKVAEVVYGTHAIFSHLLNQRLTLTNVDGKEAKEVAQQTANDVDQMRRP